MLVGDQIRADLTKVVSRELNFDLPVEKIHLERPQERSHGDYATNVAIKLSKELKQSPMEIATVIVNSWQTSLPDYLDRVEIVKPGFINLWLAEECLKDVLEEMREKEEGYGRGDRRDGKRILVEFAHPNTHKLFHIGHLRNICLGESLCRLLEAVGYEVIRANYQGDVGLHIAKVLWAILQEAGAEKMREIREVGEIRERVAFLGECYVVGNRAGEEDAAAQREIGGINEKIYNQSDEEVNKLWEETREWSLDYFERIYQRLGTTFDRLYFESEVSGRGKELALEYLEKGVFEESDGAIIFDGEKVGLHKRVFVTKVGFPTYEAKDLGLAELQFSEYQPDAYIHVVSSEQEDYFKVIFKALEEVVPKTKGKEQHFVYGWVSLKGGKMSSREGNIVTGESLIDRAKERTRSEEVAVGAVKYFMLKQSPRKDIVFDVEKSVGLQGNTGPYLQYAYVRCRSILGKVGEGDRGSVRGGDKGDKGDVGVKSEEREVLRLLSAFPEVVVEAAEAYSPNLICNFLFELAQAFNSFYERHRVIGGGAEEFRLALVGSTAQVLKNGLELLGIPVPEEM